MNQMFQAPPQQVGREEQFEHKTQQNSPSRANCRGWRRSEALQKHGPPVEPRPRCDGTSIELSFAKASGPLFGDLVSVSRRVLGDEDLAWDAVQESFLSLWLAGSAPENVGGWLRGAVIHRSLHLARSRSRRRRREDRVTASRQERSERDDPARSMELEELAAIVLNALARIAPELREILMLSLNEPMAYASIAERLGVPIGTVRSRLSRSRQALREVLLRTLPEEYRLLLPDSPVH